MVSLAQRVILLVILLGWFAQPASAVSLLPTTTVTTAITAAVGTTYYYAKRNISRVATIQFNFVYGSGGTTLDTWVQTSLDGGTTWTDVANFHATTSNLRKIINLSSLTPETTQVTPTDGSMTSNTAQDGVIGDRWRVKWTTTGTYAGGTTIAVDIQTDQLQIYP